jgi:hypothetical protein
MYYFSEENINSLKILVFLDITACCWEHYNLQGHSVNNLNTELFSTLLEEPPMSHKLSA